MQIKLKWMKSTGMALIVILVLSTCSTSNSNVDFITLLDSSIQQAARQYPLLYNELALTEFPRTVNAYDSLITNTSEWWTSGFFPGSLWLLYEFTNDTLLKRLATQKTLQLEQEQFNHNDHDIGFKIMCSYGNGFRLTHDSAYAKIIVQSAKTLTQRFNPTVGCLRSWGEIKDSVHYLVIIDNMMNLELLFEATRLTGDSLYYKMAAQHAQTTLKNHFRDNGSSFHVVDYNPSNGEPQEKRTAQGYSNSSAWARGQAWGLYGFTECYRETHQVQFLNQAIKIADFILHHPNLPENCIPYWDFNIPEIPNALRDASAAAIIASALIELAGYSSPEKAILYSAIAEKILNSLSSIEYRNQDGENQNFLLKHSVGNVPGKSEVDVPLSYTDYYYLEALQRYKKMKNAHQSME